MSAEYSLSFQDPRAGETAYLFEALVEAAQGAVEWRGLYAFASRNGLGSLIGDDVVQKFLEVGTLDLVLGIDSITDRPTLELAQQLAEQHPTFHPLVFWNDSAGLFHPKLSHFRYDDGDHCVVMGSGNLTAGGLRANIEAFSTLRAKSEDFDTSSLEEFWKNNGSRIRPIDGDALDRAAKNVVPRIRRTKGPRPTKPKKGEEAAEETDADDARVLIAEIPAAGARWHQAHFNIPSVEKFFRIQPDANQRVFLTPMLAGGKPGDQEVRPLIYSHTNKNMKIELGARADVTYPDAGKPIAVFKERQLRTFSYVLLMPGEPGYEEMEELLSSLPRLGPGTHRALTTISQVANRWGDCPLLGDEDLEADSLA